MWLIIHKAHIVLCILQHSKYFHLIISFQLNSIHYKWMLLTLIGIPKKNINMEKYKLSKVTQNVD